MQAVGVGVGADLRVCPFRHAVCHVLRGCFAPFATTFTHFAVMCAMFAMAATAVGALRATPLRPPRDVAKSAIGVTATCVSAPLFTTPFAPFII